jgi:hypothetical protein
MEEKSLGQGEKKEKKELESDVRASTSIKFRLLAPRNLISYDSRSFSPATGGLYFDPFSMPACLHPH